MQQRGSSPVQCLQNKALSNRTSSAVCEMLVVVTYLPSQSPSMLVFVFATKCADIIRGYRVPHVSVGGNSFTSPTSVHDCSPSVNVSLYLIRTFSCKINAHATLKLPLSLVGMKGADKTQCRKGPNIICIVLHLVQSINSELFFLLS